MGTNYKPNNRRYKLERYDPIWPERFKEIKKRLERIFASSAIRIEHVGSTSIPCMTAKPIIDVLVIVKALINIENEKAEMKREGYQLLVDYIADDTLVFHKYRDGERVENIHVIPEGHPEIPNFIDKRDYLLLHPQWKDFYKQLKEDLFQRFHNDYPSYYHNKKKFLDETLANLILQWKKVSEKYKSQQTTTNEKGENRNGNIGYSESSQ